MGNAWHKYYGRGELWFSFPFERVILIHISSCYFFVWILGVTVTISWAGLWLGAGRQHHNFPLLYHLLQLQLAFRLLWCFGDRSLSGICALPTAVQFVEIGKIDRILILKEFVLNQEKGSQCPKYFPKKCGPHSDKGVLWEICYCYCCGIWLISGICQHKNNWIFI